METAAVAHCCYINEVPFAAVRTISDTPECSGVKNCFANLEKSGGAVCSCGNRNVKEQMNTHKY